HVRPMARAALAGPLGTDAVLRVSPLTQHLTFPLLTVTVLASFGSSLLYGYNLAVVNSPAVHIKAFYNASWSQRYSQSPSQELLTVMYSLTVSVFALGGLVGSLPVGTRREPPARNGTLVRSPLLVFLAGILMGSSRYLELPEMVIAGRFVTGLHSGICLSVVPMYLGEIAPKNLRGFLGLVPSIFICLGVFSAQVLGLPELLGEVSAASGLHGVPLKCCCCSHPVERGTRAWGCLQGSPEQVTPTLFRVEKSNAQLQVALSTSGFQPIRKWLISGWVSCACPMRRWQQSAVKLTVFRIQSLKLTEIWIRSHPSPCQPPASSWPPKIPHANPQPAAGPPPSSLHSPPAPPRAVPQTCLRHAGGGNGTVSPAASSLCPFSPQAAVPWMRYLSVACVIGIIAGFCMGPAGVPFLMTAELFKQSHRPAAYIVGGSLNWLSNFTVGFVFPFLQMSAGAFCYLVFCGVCLLVALYIYVVIPETKNKTFMEISQIFAARRAFLATPASAVKMVALGGYGALESSSLELSESGQA
uniref:Major facilitator superfamily (MFS) profile domain-containing protein n=1 Tax=Pelodiscus sinensis TaxID=13735 RepID=K7FFC2_PELSI